MDKERKFKELNDLIDNLIKNKSDIVDKTYQEYDDEYLKLEKIYESNLKSLNFIKYNYFLRKSYQKSLNTQTRIEFILKAFCSFLKINSIKSEKFIFKIQMAIEEIYMDDVMQAIKLLQNLNKIIIYNKQNSKNIKQDEMEIMSAFCKRIFKYISSLVINVKEIHEKTEDLKVEMIVCFEAMQQYKRDSNASSILSSAIYILCKKKSIYMIRLLYFEKNEKYRENIVKNLKKLISNMVEYSQKSLKITKKNFTETNEKAKLMITLKEIDKYVATYFKLLYYDRNTNAAWKKINEMKQFIVYKVFKENVLISPGLMKIIIEEWNLLQAFNKISLLKNEIVKLMNNSETEWIKEILKTINIEFENIEKLFKYEENKSSVTKLENIDDSFMGTLIEYLLYELLKYMKENKSKILSNSKIDYLDLLLNIEKCEEIILNNIVINDEPDIDIDLLGKGAILIKNAKIKNEEYKTIEKEINLIIKYAKYKKMYYLINFNKNIENVVELKTRFSEYESKYNIEIKVTDIKEFYSSMLHCLKEPKKKYNFSEEQLYKIFGY